MPTNFSGKKTIVVREHKPVFHDASVVLPELCPSDVLSPNGLALNSGSCLVKTDNDTYHMAWLCDDHQDGILYWWDLSTDDEVEGNVIGWARIDIHPSKQDFARLNRNALRRINREIMNEPEVAPA